MDSFLEELCRDAVQEYHEKYEEDIPIGGEMQELLEEGEVAGREEVEEFAEELFGFYDELLETDSATVQDEFLDNIVYDLSTLERITAFFTSPDFEEAENCISLPAVGLSVLGGGVLISGQVSAGLMLFGVGIMDELRLQYDVNGDAVLEDLFDGKYRCNGAIGVHPSTTTRKNAFSNLSAELYHAYQDAWRSPTYRDALLVEGSERAVRLKAVEFMAEQEEGWDRIYDALRANVLVSGYAEMCAGDEGLFVGDLISMGLSPMERGLVMAYVGSEDSLQYNVGASLMMMAEERHGEGVYAEVFHGEYSSLPGEAFKYRREVRERSEVGEKLRDWPEYLE